jgi:3-oxoacyl-[acyl-carrier protein] reductase
MPELEQMMKPEDIAEAVVFVLTRPRTYRVLELAMRHMSESSWG